MPAEPQGKWDQAEKDYRKILEQNPRYPGIHFRLARLILSKPNPPPDFAEQAKKELQQELEIDPANAGAEYVLGELARQAQDLPEAVQHFSKATELDPNFADAFLGLGMTLAGGEEISRRGRSAGKSSQASARKSCRTLQPGHCLRAYRTARRCGSGICFAAEDFSDPQARREPSLRSDRKEDTVIPQAFSSDPGRHCRVRRRKCFLAPIRQRRPALSFRRSARLR